MSTVDVFFAGFTLGSLLTMLGAWFVFVRPAYRMIDELEGPMSNRLDKIEAEFKIPEEAATN